MSGKQKSFKKGSQKTFAAKRRINPPQARGDAHARRNTGAPFQQEDVKRRLGSFEGAGEHARTGSRGHE